MQLRSKYDEVNVKALYRRGCRCLYIKAPSAGGFQIDSALSDLKAAFKIEPNNSSVKREAKSPKAIFEAQAMFN